MDEADLYSATMALKDNHPAKAFLLAFLRCRDECVGRELDPDQPIDQRWESTSENKPWAFSEFAYAFLSLDLALDEFHRSPPTIDEASTNWPWNVDRLRTLINECIVAARHSHNLSILALADEILRMLTLWERYLAHRRELTDRS
jgi:hypothetical protein